ncbi:hypothetical protein SXCC_00506 [Gluconacetobacter sp. SXCC-1]|nr:hypothetical protein SXCC_00506 [Gluconacetobacter sp. SXCC-1]
MPRARCIDRDHDGLACNGNRLVIRRTGASLAGNAAGLLTNLQSEGL